MEDLNPNTIKANELRIGNLIYNSYTQDVFSVYSMFIVQFSKTEDTNIKPVLLTEEWLLKFGFKNIKEHWVKYDDKPEGFHTNSICIIQHKDLFSRKHLSFSFSASGNYNPNSIDFEVKYVHQLQNLYFALTGEELIIDPE